MTQPHSDVYRYIVKELKPSAHKPDEASLSIVCEPVNAPGHQSTVTLHLEAGTTLAEAQEIAATLHSKVKGLFHTQVKKDEPV